MAYRSQRAAPERDSLLRAHPERPTVRPLRVGVAPLITERNNYQGLLYDAVERTGQAAIVPIARFTPGWALRARKEVDVVHLHWLEYLLAGKEPPGLRDVARRAAAALIVVLTIAVLKLTRVRVVWTAHNRRPHDSTVPRAHDLLYKVAARLSDEVIVHSTHAGKAVRGDLGRRGAVRVVPHGHYIGAYPDPQRSRTEVRKSYGIPEDAFVLLAFGQVRAYKRIEDLLREFPGIAGESIRLLVVGSPHDAEEVRRIEALARRDPRVHLDLRFVPDSEVAELHAAADLAVLNYREMFSSGALLLALSLGVPVMVPERGGAGEIGGPPAVNTFARSALKGALEDYRAMVDPGVACDEALRAASRASWENSADLHLEAFGAPPTRGREGT